jgi:hypothetical protein
MHLETKRRDAALPAQLVKEVRGEKHGVRRSDFFEKVG